MTLLSDAPRLLDLFCCEGGAGAGYAQAGFTVHGVDIEPRFAKRYPFEFTAMDAFDYLDKHADEFDAIHASPPCQFYSITNAARRWDYPALIDPIREALAASGKPYVIENVVGARSHLRAPVTLCWSMFNTAGSVIDTDGTPLRMERHRLFETNWSLEAPAICQHPRDVQVAGSYGGARRDKIEAREIRRGGYVPSIDVQRDLLGIDWMTQNGMYQSIPPAYTRYIGAKLAGIAA